MGFVRSLLDFLLAFWLIKSIAFSILVEYPMAKYGSEWTQHAKENPLLELTNDMVAQYKFDQLLLDMPTWLIFSTYLHCMYLAPMYGFIALSLITGLFAKLRNGLGFMVGSQLFYGIMQYFLIELLGDVPPPSQYYFIVFNIDYIVGALWLIIRFWPSSSGQPKVVAPSKTKKSQ